MHTRDMPVCVEFLCYSLLPNYFYITVDTLLTSSTSCHELDAALDTAGKPVKKCIYTL